MAFSTFNSFNSSFKTSPFNTILGFPDVNLIFRYKFDIGDISNNFLKNVVTNTYDASINNPQAVISTTIFKKGNGSIYNPTFTVLPSFTLSPTAISVSFWLYNMTPNKDFTTFFSFGNVYNSLSNSITFGFLDSFSSVIRIRDGVKGTIPRVDDSKIIPLNVWTHISCVIKNDNTATTYYNGILISNISYSYPGVQIYNFNHIGSQINENDYDSVYSKLNCYIDDFRINNGYALTQADVTQIYNSN